jgi:hypothetical protein
VHAARNKHGVQASYTAGNKVTRVVPNMALDYVELIKTFDRQSFCNPSATLPLLDIKLISNNLFANSFSDKIIVNLNVLSPCMKNMIN